MNDRYSCFIALWYLDNTHIHCSLSENEIRPSSVTVASFRYPFNYNSKLVPNSVMFSLPYKHAQ